MSKGGTFKEEALARPFTDEEYASRVARVAGEIEKRSIDVLYVTDAANLNYLTGYLAVWYSRRSPVGLAIDSKSGHSVFFDYIRHEQLAETYVLADDIVIYGDEVYEHTSGISAILKDFRARGWSRGVVGLEKWSYTPSGVLRESLQAGLESAGAEVVDGSWIVDHVRAYKSPKEVEYIRLAADIVNGAMTDITSYIKEGVTEIEIAARLNLLMAERGGEEPAMPLMASSAPEEASHLPASRRKLRRGEVLELDTCGVYNRYHVDSDRCFSLGPNERAKEILDITSGSIEAVCKHVRVGMPVTEAHRVAEQFVKEAGLWKYVWWVGGYSLGVALPPDWCGHIYLDGGAFETPTFQPGYVTNYENCLSSVEEGWIASYIDTLLMTEDGLEILTTTPRTLVVL